MLRRLDYQSRALGVLDAYVEVLKVEKQRSDEVTKVADEKKHLRIKVPDFTKEAWESVRSQGKLPLSRAEIPFSQRLDGCGRPVPNAVFKIPTGGGKTWLAITGLSSIFGNYLASNTGFVLWIVPNEAIYTQTLRNLKDRQHPYRQALDRASAGRVLVLEKSDSLNAHDMEANLCVMLLMLQSVNRGAQESLKIFQDRGDVHGFFPAEGEQQAHQAALERTPNLAAYQGLFPMVKDSLGNALRIIRPVFILDEGHRAISDLAFQTLYGLNPCFVLELTATPQDVRARSGKSPRSARFANLLVEVTGREVDREGMIKMPLNLDPRQGTDWRSTLYSAVKKLEQLGEAAARLRAETDRYIRPIMLVQVERTGAEQRESGRIHSEDVKDVLLTAGFDETEIAIKTADKNDLRQPENQDLLSPTNRIRVIITKQALQEGWDCPFAYLLCSLAASSSLSAMTQLVGRILRQPYAEKTGISALDECHIVTHRAETASVVKAVKQGLERDGLGDLVIQFGEQETGAVQEGPRRLSRRPKFAKREIYLPKVVVSENGRLRELDYETDLLCHIDWRDFDPSPIAARIPLNARPPENQLQRITISDDQGGFAGAQAGRSGELLQFEPSYAVRMILDIVLNPFVGREIVGRLLFELRKREFDNSNLGRQASLIVEELRNGLRTERDVRAEALFKAGANNGRIQFHLRYDGLDWRMPFRIETTAPSNSPQLLNASGAALQRSLFVPVYQQDLNSDEREFAVYLDGEKTLAWWHRNIARSQYGLQGWQDRRIYPDFVFSMTPDGKRERIAIVETKGDHLDNTDTDYKRKLMSFLSSGQWRTSTEVRDGPRLLPSELPSLHYELVLMSDWRTRLPSLVAGGLGEF